ncbi:MAG: hypothetical protein DWQ07_18960 [Chloroflexi bacterium]|nr:MAG: hypothetical protein DWQ07_18960 [Chloroflexota bacterium]MBL1195013.1 hypothetical protein [Chloroflexota bacterium]NOH12302.1 hypothetical protein [Chloroflexota bacterium]
MKLVDQFVEATKNRFSPKNQFMARALPVQEFEKRYGIDYLVYKNATPLRIPRLLLLRRDRK